MADLTQASVVVNRAWNEAGPAGRDLSCRLVTLNIGGFGSITNRIPSSLLGLSVIEQAGPFTAAANTKVYLAAPNVNTLAGPPILTQGQALLLVDLTQAVDASRIPADITDLITGVVKGY
jgi:hypothetical protein